MPYQNASIDFTGRKPKETYTRIVQCSGSTNSIFSTGDGWRIESADVTASYAINASGTASFSISSSYAQSSSWEVFTKEYATSSLSSSWASASWNSDYATTASWASQSLRADGANVATFAWSAESSSWASSSMTSSTANKVQVIITPGLGDIPVILGHYTGNGPRLLFDDANNIFYRDVRQELHVPTSIATIQSASSKVMTDPGGSMTASFFDGRTSVNIVGFVGTASWAQTSSYAINGGTLLETGSTYQITASWAQTSSYAINGGTLLETASLYQITASWAQTSSYALSEVTVETFSSTSLSSSWASQSLSASFISGTYGFVSQLTTTTISSSGGLFGTASWAEFAVAGGTQLYTASTYPITASWATNAVRADSTPYASLAGDVISGSWSSASLSASYAPLITGQTYTITSSWATNAINGGTTLNTGSTYPITASWSISASWAQNGLITNSLYPVTTSQASSAISSSWTLNAYTASALYIPSGSGAWRIEVSSSGDLVFIFS